jgi:phosphoribosyl 1,2-cyclic phosphate phosphodiesterase
MLQYQIQKIDAIVFTHHHFDHIGGFDDIRPYNFMGNKGPVQIYLMESTLKGLKQTFAYAFGAAEQSGGGLPQAEVHLIDQDPFQIGDITITPIPLLHGNMRVNGYKIGSMAYCTDTNFIPETSYTRLMGLDTLILDALRYEKHPTHFTIQQACVQAARIGAKKTYFTHIAHQIRHADCEANLPAGCYLSFDGLVINA